MQKFEVYMNGVFLESFALDVRDCKHFFFYFLSKINQYMRRAEEIKAFLKVYNALGEFMQLMNTAVPSVCLSLLIYKY